MSSYLPQTGNETDGPETGGRGGLGFATDTAHPGSGSGVHVRRSSMSREQRAHPERPRSATGTAPRRMTSSERVRAAHQLAHRYEEGDSLTRISTDSGHSYGLVRRLLLDIGVVLRPRGGNHRLERPVATDAPTGLNGATSSSSAETVGNAGQDGP
jgi:Helix-turn-helix domain